LKVSDDEEPTKQAFFNLTTFRLVLTAFRLICPKGGFSALLRVEAARRLVVQVIHRIINIINIFRLVFPNITLKIEGDRLF
jgi:hypothetical protein